MVVLALGALSCGDSQEASDSHEAVDGGDSVGDCVSNWLTFAEFAFRPGESGLVMSEDSASLLVADPEALDVVEFYPGVGTDSVRQLEFVSDGLAEEVNRSLPELVEREVIFVGRVSIANEFLTLLVERVGDQVLAFDPCTLEWRDITLRFNEGVGELGATSAEEAIATLVSNEARREVFLLGWDGAERRAQEAADAAAPVYPGVGPGDPPGGCDPNDSRARRALLNEPLTSVFPAQAAEIDGLLNDHELSDSDLAVALVDVIGDDATALFNDDAHARETLLAALSPAPECNPPQIEPTGDPVEDCVAFTLANWEWRGLDREAALATLAASGQATESAAVSFLEPILGTDLSRLSSSEGVSVAGLTFTIADNVYGTFLSGRIGTEGLLDGFEAALQREEAAVVANLTSDRDFNPDLDDAALASIEASLQSIEENGLSIAAATFAGPPEQLAAVVSADQPIYRIVISESPEAILYPDPASFDSWRNFCRESPAEAEEASFTYRRPR